MPKLTHIQRSFSTGEISPKMLMRGDTEQYASAALTMRNFMPTPQGSAVRMPGTRHLQVLDVTNARIIPYLSVNNERLLTVFKPGLVRVYQGVMDVIEGGNSFTALPPNTGTVNYRRNYMPNADFINGLDSWTETPGKYFGGNNDGPLGVFPVGRFVVMSPRFHGQFVQTESAVCTLENKANITTPTDVGTILYRAVYQRNPWGADRKFKFTVTVSTSSDYSNPVVEDVYTQDTTKLGADIDIEKPFNLPAGFTGELYVKIAAEAVQSSDDFFLESSISNPQFRVDRLRIIGNASRQVTQDDLVTPYAAEDLPDLQYVQSPYNNKELVVTHPKHPPHRLLRRAGVYVFEEIPFQFPPTTWAPNNYPSACTSYHGRLILAGGQTFRVDPADPFPTDTETVWGTEVGQWDRFSDPLDPEAVNPDDSIEFTAVYRSPIQWVYGQRTLLIGSLEYEYSASGEGIFSPGDLGVFLQSTHGSNNVQPAAFGSGVLFPADGGTSVRSMTWQQNVESWEAADLTLLNPEICQPKIVRMARCRNPYQMCLVLTTTGNMSVFVSESGVEGWCRYQMNKGLIRDMCVAPDNSGLDVPFFLVERNINGTVQWHLECIPSWSEATDWSYQNAALQFDLESPSATLTGLEHLEGEIVQVRDARNYLGFYRVAGGQITIKDVDGTDLAVNTAEVGLSHEAVLRTLPVDAMEPGAKKRFSEFSVRVLASIRPIINGERPEDRDPLQPLGVSQPRDLIRDINVRVLSWQESASIEISERIPFPVEVLGVYGELQVNKV